MLQILHKIQVNKNVQEVLFNVWEWYKKIPIYTNRNEFNPKSLSLNCGGMLRDLIISFSILHFMKQELRLQGLHAAKNLAGGLPGPEVRSGESFQHRIIHHDLHIKYKSSGMLIL